MQQRDSEWRVSRLHSSHVTYVQCEHEGGAYLLCASVSLLRNGLSRTHLAGESCRDSKPMSSCLVDMWHLIQYRVSVCGESGYQMNYRKLEELAFQSWGPQKTYLLPQHLTPTWKGCTPGPKHGESCLGSSGAADLRPGVLFPTLRA